MKIKIIAEAGVNHNGNLEIAKKLIDEAARAGADYVKFQTFKADKLLDKSAKKAKYQEETTGKGGQYEMLKKLELSENDHFILKDYCIKKGIKFLSTAFDVDSLKFLVEDVEIDMIKIPSGEINNYFLLKKIAQYNIDTVMSTGMCDLSEIHDSLNFLLKHGLNKENLTILHCTTAYPTKIEDVNLKAILTIKNEFNCPVGYSDHTLGNEVCIASIGMGSVVLEKHFTLDKKMEGPDHLASMEPDQLRDLVKAVRDLEIGLGNGDKKPKPIEIENKKIARKSLFYLSDVEAGETLSEAMLTAKRPASGINPLKLDELLGKKLKHSVKSGGIVKFSDYE